MIDLFCGLGGWADGFLAEGYRAFGFDIERHVYGEQRYPAQLILQDACTIHGSQLRNAACIVASPPCQEYSYMAMPWSRAKQIAAALRGDIGEHDGIPVPFPEGYTGSRTVEQLNELFNTCFRIQREACEAAGRYIPMVVENVKGAQPWVGPAKAHFGSFYLWGDIESVGDAIVASVPKFGEVLRAARRGTGRKKNPDGTEHPQGSWFKIANSINRGAHKTPEGNCSVPMWKDRDEHEKTGKPGRSFQSVAVEEKGFAREFRDSPNGMPMMSSKSPARKAASAQIAKIPFPLAQHIARVFRPDGERTLAEANK